MFKIENWLPIVTPKLILISAFLCICFWFVFVDYNIIWYKSFFTFMSGVFVSEWLSTIFKVKEKKDNDRSNVVEMIRGINKVPQTSSLKS